MGKQIYNESGLLDVSQSVKAPRVKVETKLEEKFDKELDVINKKMYNTAQVSSTVAMKDLYALHSDNPAKLEESIEKVQIDTADLFRDKDTREAFVLNSEVSKITYVNRAKTNFENKQNKELKISSNALVDTNMDLMSENAISMWNGDEDAKILLNESYTAIVEQMKETDSKGAPLYTDSQIKAIETQFSNMKVESYKDNLDSLYVTNPAQAKIYANEFNAKTRDELGLSRKEYDSIKKYNGTVETAYKKLEGSRNPNTGEAYTDDEKLLLAKEAEGLTVNYGEMEVSKGKVKNKLYNNIDSMVMFRDSAVRVRDGKVLTKAKYDAMMVQTGRALYNMIENENFDIGKKSVETLLKKQVNAMNLDPAGKLRVFEDTWGVMIDKGIETNSYRPEDVAKASKIFKNNAYRYLQEEVPSSIWSKGQNIITDDYIESFNPLGTENEGTNLDSSTKYKQEFDWDEGQWYNVKRNSAGDILDRTPAMIILGLGI